MGIINKLNIRKLILFTEKALLVNFSVLFLLAPYFRSVSKICFCIGIVLWIMLNVLRYKGKFYSGVIPKTFLNIPIFIFLCAGVCSMVFSRNTYHSQSIFFERYVPFVFFFFMVAGLIKGGRNAEQRGLPVVGKIYFLIGSILLSACIFGVGGVFDYFVSHPSRLFTVFGKEITFCMFPLYLVYFIPVSYALLVFSKKWRLKIISGIIFILLILCWIWQGSRMAWIAIPLTLSVITFIKNRKAALLLILSFLVIFALFPRRDVERVKRIFTVSEWTVPCEGWGVALSIFKDYPIFGAGIGMYEDLILPYGEKLGYPHARFKYLHAHNMYLEIASEMGIVGFISFLSIFVVFLFKSFKVLGRLPRDRQPVLLGLAGTVLATLFMGFWSSIITVGVQGPSFFWALLGFAAAIAEEGIISPRSTVNGL